MKDLWNGYRKVVSDSFPDLKFDHQWCNWKSNLNLEANILKGDYILKSREAIIWNDKTCIYNTIIYPKTGSDLPCFGMDLMCFFEKKVVLTFDFQHPRENYLFSHPHILHECKGGIRFFEPGNHFSKHLYVAKCTASEVNEHLLIFRDYVRTYATMVYEAKPTGEDTSVYADFDSYMTKLDPVGGYLASNFGKEESEKFVNEFLFSWAK